MIKPSNKRGKQEEVKKMVLVKDIYLTAEEVDGLEDKSFTIAKGCQYRKMLQIDGSEQDKLVVPVKLSNGIVRDWVPNKTSVKALVSKFGAETDNWIGKKAVFKIVEQKVRGETRKVIYIQ